MIDPLDGGRLLRRFPWPLLATCLALLAVSLVVLQSASLAPSGRSFPYAAQQVVWAGAGLVAFAVATLVPYDRVGRRWAAVYLLGLALLVLVLLIGTKVNGSRRWFSLGPIRAQPSELMKYLLAIVLAHLVARQGERVRTWRGLAEAGAVTAVPAALVMAQPDLGTSLTYWPVLGAIVFAAGARRAHLLSIAGLGVLAAPVMWLFVLRDYQKGRILSFLDSDGQALGGAYQTTQSVIAIGSGGVFGRGHLQGTQGPLGFLPERHTDFVFGVIGEDWGLAGGLVILALYAALLSSLLHIARTTRDPEGRYLAVGVAAITLMQIGVNMGMAMGVAPVTGLTLPLVSYGGSSLLTTLAAYGLVASVACRRRIFLGAAAPAAAPARRPGALGADQADRLRVVLGCEG